MVETVYDLCQPSMLTKMFPAKPGSSFFFPWAIHRYVTANMKVIKTQSDPTHAISPWGALGESSCGTAPNDGL